AQLELDSDPRAAGDADGAELLVTPRGPRGVERVAWRGKHVLTQHSVSGVAAVQQVIDPREYVPGRRQLEMRIHVEKDVSGDRPVDILVVLIAAGEQVGLRQGFQRD